MELRIDRLSKTYANGTQALREVSLTVPSGIFGLLGPNGAGKSTLIRTLSTLQRADSGTVRLIGSDGDIDVLGDPGAARATLGYLPQEFGLPPKVRCADLLDHLAFLKGFERTAERKARVADLLRRVNLHDARDARLGTFSGGMRQRFGIAQALIGFPRLVIVDEPTAGLDPEERVRFHNLLAEMSRDIVMILSTHIVQDVQALCDRVAIIDRGTIRVVGSPASLTDAIAGTVWTATVDSERLVSLRAAGVPILSTRLASGRVVVSALGERPPHPEFAAAAPQLEDVYFAAIAAAPSNRLP